MARVHVLEEENKRNSELIDTLLADIRTKSDTVAKQADMLIRNRIAPRAPPLARPIAVVAARAASNTGGDEDPRAPPNTGTAAADNSGGPAAAS